MRVPARCTCLAIAALLGAPLAAQDSLPPDRLEHQKRWGLALATHFGANAVPWFFNRYISEQFWARISPESWKHNLEVGWTWDDNDIKTNQFAHPYHGGLYFSAFRSNGFNFWQSAPWTFVGSWTWEHFGELYPPSPNDYLTTSLGGITLGEVQHRMSSLILDQTISGSARRWKELAALLVDPVRGFNRIFTGQAWQHTQNPPEWRPESFGSVVRLGLRRSGDGHNLANGQDQVFLDVDFRYGNALAGVRKPFDAFRLEVELHTNDTSLISRAMVGGFLAAWPVVEGRDGRLVLGFTNRYDYLNNFAYVVGGSSFGVAGLWRYRMSEPLGLRLGLELTGMPVSLIQSEAAQLVGRNYDFGVGLGYRFEGSLDVRGREIVSLRGGSIWSSTVNGSDSEHFIHFAFVNAAYPLRQNFAVGASLGFFQRDSDYGPLGDVTKRTPELRAWVAWRLD